MIAGQTVSPGPGESLTCVRSALDGGPFELTFELAPGANGPPRHSHDEGDEVIEVVDGVLEIEVNGEWRRLGPGESITLAPSDVHTFRNGSKTEPLRCRGTAGPRFERVIELTNLLEVCYYATFVDPGASRVHDLHLRVLMPILGTVGKLLGVGRRLPRASRS